MYHVVTMAHMVIFHLSNSWNYCNVWVFSLDISLDWIIHSLRFQRIVSNHRVIGRQDGRVWPSAFFAPPGFALPQHGGRQIQLNAQLDPRDGAAVNGLATWRNGEIAGELGIKKAGWMMWLRTGIPKQTVSEVQCSVLDYVMLFLWYYVILVIL